MGRSCHDRAQARGALALQKLNPLALALGLLCLALLAVGADLKLALVFFVCFRF